MSTDKNWAKQFDTRDVPREEWNAALDRLAVVDEHLSELAGILVNAVDRVFILKGIARLTKERAVLMLKLEGKGCEL